MKLRKDKWANVKIKDCCEILDNLRKPISAIERERRIENKKQEELYPYYGATGLVGWVDDYLIDDQYVLIGEDGAPFFDKSKDIAYLIKGKSWVNNHVHILKAKPKIADDIYILHYLNSFNDFGGYVNGTTRLKLNKGQLERIPIPLPPLEEQKQIAALFQSIETAMEQVDGQEKNLKALWKKLIDEFVSDKPSFGNLLKGKKLKTYNYCEVTEKLMRKIDPLTYGIERIVAGENLESEDFKIRTWQKVGEGYLGPAFHVLFKAGDILYGSRRTYLRKVSHADFDGVCANTTYVIRANEELLLQDLLKHIMLSERFTQYSIGVSKGSTNPYINWKDLDNFSFQVPDLETQRDIINVLDGILQIVEQLKQQKTTLKHLKQKLLNEILG